MGLHLFTLSRLFHTHRIWPHFTRKRRRKVSSAKRWEMAILSIWWNKDHLSLQRCTPSRVQTSPLTLRSSAYSTFHRYGMHSVAGCKETKGLLIPQLGRHNTLSIYDAPRSFSYSGTSNAKLTPIFSLSISFIFCSRLSDLGRIIRAQLPSTSSVANINVIA